MTLKQAYYEAGIREYWLVDARQEPLVFDIFRHTSRGYVRTAKQQEWVKSGVFGTSFRLSVRAGLQRHPAYKLDIR